MSPNYSQIWAHLKELKWFILVTTGRTGSDFLHSLLDSHPQVSVFNGKIFFYDFWTHAVSVQSQGPVSASDLTDEFTGRYISSFKSVYDVIERKNALGDNQDQSIDIDTSEFKQHMSGLLEGVEVTARNYLTAVYGAYELCLGRDVFRMKIVFHHEHRIRYVPAFMKDFPEAKAVCMIRDPRALYVSGVENWRRFEPSTDNPSYPLFILQRAVDEILQLVDLPPDQLGVLKLEDLAENKTLHTLCKWLGVDYDSAMEKATWGGLRWWGDKVSQKKIPADEPGFSKTISTNHWEQKLDSLDRTILNYLLVDVLEAYGYPARRSRNPLFALLILCVIPVPMGYERRFMAPGLLLRFLLTGRVKRAIAPFYHSMRRVIWFYRLFYRRNFGTFFVASNIGQR